MTRRKRWSKILWGLGVLNMLHFTAASAESNKGIRLENLRPDSISHHRLGHGSDPDEKVLATQHLGRRPASASGEVRTFMTVACRDYMGISHYPSDNQFQNCMEGSSYNQHPSIFDHQRSLKILEMGVILPRY